MKRLAFGVMHWHPQPNILQKVGAAKWKEEGDADEFATLPNIASPARPTSIYSLSVLKNAELVKVNDGSSGIWPFECFSPFCSLASRGG